MFSYICFYLSAELVKMARPRTSDSEVIKYYVAFCIMTNLGKNAPVV